MSVIRILSLESSAKAASAAIFESSSLLALNYQKNGLTHSRTLLPMIEAMLTCCELDIDKIDLIAVSNGPGSFTGIRIGCAAAKGLMWASGKPGCGISTLEAMAWQAINMESKIICPVMDARRLQVYNALFEIENGIPVRLCPDRAISIEDLKTDLKNAEKSIFLIGDGAELCYNTLSNFSDNSSKLKLTLAPEGLRYQNAWGVALAAANKPQKEYGGIDPVYLRPSQAERERAERENRK